MDEKDLPELVEEVDQQLLDWTIKYKLSPDMTLAIVLARMTLVAKETDNEGTLIALLDKARYNIMEESMNNKDTLH